MSDTNKEHNLNKPLKVSLSSLSFLENTRLPEVFRLFSTLNFHHFINATNDFVFTSQQDTNQDFSPLGNYFTTLFIIFRFI